MQALKSLLPSCILMRQACAFLTVKLGPILEVLVDFVKALKLEVEKTFVREQALQRVSRPGIGVVRLISKCVKVAIEGTKDMLTMARQATGVEGVMAAYDMASQEAIVQGVMDGYDIAILDLMSEQRAWTTVSNKHELFISSRGYENIVHRMNQGDWQKMNKMVVSRVGLALEVDAIVADILQRKEDADASTSGDVPV
jgi:hypothetical protein